MSKLNSRTIYDHIIAAITKPPTSIRYFLRYFQVESLCTVQFFAPPTPLRAGAGIGYPRAKIFGQIPHPRAKIFSQIPHPRAPIFRKIAYFY